MKNEPNSWVEVILIFSFLRTIRYDNQSLSKCMYWHNAHRKAQSQVTGELQYCTVENAKRLLYLILHSINSIYRSTFTKYLRNSRKTSILKLFHYLMDEKYCLGRNECPHHTKWGALKRYQFVLRLDVISMRMRSQFTCMCECTHEIFIPKCAQHSAYYLAKKWIRKMYVLYTQSLN